MAIAEYSDQFADRREQAKVDMADTDRASVRASEAPRENERLFQKVFEAIPDPSILWKREPDGRIVLRMVNPAAREMSRGRIADFVDATVEKFFQDAPHVVANIERAFETGESIRVELPCRLRTTGEDKWVVADYAKVSEDYLLNTIRDITERVEAEADIARASDALREREALLSRAEKMAHLGSWEWDIKANRVTVSDEWQRIHGCSASQLSIENLLPIVHPNDRPAVERAIERSLETGESYDIEHRIVRQNSGEVRVVKAHGEVVYDGDEPLRMYGASQDITARKQAEADIADIDRASVRASEALRESEERFRTLFNNLSDPVFIHRGDDGRIILANDIALQQYEHSREGITKFTPQSFDTPEHAARLPERLAKLHQEGRAMFETCHQTKSGRVFPVEVNAHMVTYKGETVVITVCRDITQRKRMEKALRETQEQMMQRERLAAVGQLAAGIAHDFRNLLTTIILCADMGLRKPDLPPNLGQDLESILSESRKAAELVQQILDFSSRSMIKVRPIDLKALTGETIGILRRTIPENIRLFLDVSATEAPFTVAADPSRIEQALMNLSLNARDAMPQGGELHIGLERISIKPGEAPPVPEMARHSEITGETPRSNIQGPKSKIEHRAWICLSVSDTGTGMTEAVQAHLFEPFFTTKEVGEGTGLGLAQVYGIIRQHEGYIDVETEVGKGTTFRIYLPAFVEQEEANKRHSSGEEKDTDMPQGRGELILLVEDNDKVREAGRSILESLGYRTLVAANGREALSVYEAEGGANLVITDMVMPEMGGKQLVQRLRRMDPNLRALGLTGYAVEKVARESREIGFVDVIHKPFRMETLAWTIRRALDGE